MLVVFDRLLLRLDEPLVGVSCFWWFALHFPNLLGLSLENIFDALT